MKRNTSISTDLKHVTKMIDPRSGKVIREGTTPMATVGAFKANPTHVVSPDIRLSNLEKGMDRLEKLIVKALDK